LILSLDFLMIEKSLMSSSYLSSFSILTLFWWNRRNRRNSSRESVETQERYHWMYLSHVPLSRLSHQVDCTVQSWGQH
jgi:hypothetical protein